MSNSTSTSNKSYPELTLAAFLNCSKLEVLALRSRLLEAVDSASEPESRSVKTLCNKLPIRIKQKSWQK